jgi:hypothetical protein
MSQNETNSGFQTLIPASSVCTYTADSKTIKGTNKTLMANPINNFLNPRTQFINQEYMGEHCLHIPVWDNSISDSDSVVPSLPIHDFTSFTSHDDEETKEKTKRDRKDSGEISFKGTREFGEKSDGSKFCDYEGSRNYFSRNDLVNKEDGSELKGGRRGADRRVWDDK